MTRYYFDLRDEQGVMTDEEGMELPTVQAVQEEAAQSLADMARDEMRKELGQDRNHHRSMAVEVRDDDGPLMTVKFTFEIDRNRW